MLTQHQQRHEQDQPPGATADKSAKCFSSAMIVEFTIISIRMCEV
ncbi:hypothetical protein [Gleimia hominis]|nr:hypothetical protein [Gleimia hominis]WIK65057.1 hypothetical protein CJ187_003115 [Gleimia hominis]